MPVTRLTNSPVGMQILYLMIASTTIFIVAKYAPFSTLHAAEDIVRFRLLPTLRVRGDIPQLRTRATVRRSDVRAVAAALAASALVGADVVSDEPCQCACVYHRHQRHVRPGTGLLAQPPGAGRRRHGGRTEDLYRVRRCLHRDSAFRVANVPGGGLGTLGGSSRKQCGAVPVMPRIGFEDGHRIASSGKRIGGGQASRATAYTRNHLLPVNLII